MASLYPLGSQFFYRIGIALRDQRLGAQLRSFLNHSALNPDTIDNTGGTVTTGDTLLVVYGSRST